MPNRQPLGPSGSDALGECLTQMAKVYRKDPMKAVRGQSFIKLLHTHLGEQLTARLTPWALDRGITIKYEANLLGSHKPKDVDVAVLDPDNGPLMCIGIRSQMSSVGKNAMNYYEGIIGECISLQDRFPLATHGYLYMMPTKPIKDGKQSEHIDHSRYAKMYAAISGRAGIGYDKVRGIYDEFAYLIVDFDSEPPTIRDDLLGPLGGVDLSVSSFVDRLVETFAKRMLFWDVFDVSPAGGIGR